MDVLYLIIVVLSIKENGKNIYHHIPRPADVLAWYVRRRMILSILDALRLKTLDPKVFKFCLIA